MRKSVDYDKIADIYDVVENVHFDIPFYLNEAKKIDGDILELMCGTGRLTLKLLAEGRKVTCLDYSSGMLEKLKNKIKDLDNKPQIIYRDVTELDIKKKFDLVIMPFHSICQIESQQKQFQTILKINSHLKEGGKFICATLNPVVRFRNHHGIPKVLGKYKYSDELDLIITEINEYHHINNSMTGWQFYEFYDHDNILRAKRYLNIKLKPIFYKVMCEMFTAAGFNVEDVYGDYDYGKFDEEKSQYMVFKTSKR